MDARKRRMINGLAFVGLACIFLAWFAVGGQVLHLALAGVTGIAGAFQVSRAWKA
jgi:hypothetical protein